MMGEGRCIVDDDGDDYDDDGDDETEGTIKIESMSGELRIYLKVVDG